jgi:5'(3')-deoxyribonucleotidase
MLFTIERFVLRPAASVSSYLLGFPLIYALYLVSGGARKYTYGVTASYFLPITVFLALFFGLWVAYETTGPPSSIRNAVFLTSAAVSTIGYRASRAWYRKFLHARKRRGNRIGVDLDGVLADQVGHILPRINAEQGTSLTREDVDEWRLPLPRSDIACEINKALTDPEYVLTMPPLPGAKRLLNRLFWRHEIIILTARPREALEWTRIWLDRNGLSFDQLIAATEAKKSLHGCDVLVDDYIGNVVEYLANSKGVAVLVDQPWNRRRKQLDPWIRDGRAAVAADLDAVPALIARLLRGEDE